MAYIQTRKNKKGEITSYTITVDVGFDENGKRRRCSKQIKPFEIKATTPKAIEKELKGMALDFERDIKTRSLCLDHSKDTFKEYAEYYLNKKKKTGQQVLTTLQNNRNRLNYKIYPVIGNLKIVDIKPIIISDLLLKIESGEYSFKAKKASPIYVKDCFILLNAIFEDACRNEVILKNPCLNVKKDLPKIQPSKKIKYFEIEQARKFLELFEEDTLMWKTFFNLALVTGCRREELLGLRFKNIDYKKGTISITSARVRDNDGKKGKKYIDKDPKSQSSCREIPIFPYVLDILKKYETEQKKMFLLLSSENWQGNPDFKECYVFASAVGKELTIDAPLRKMKRKIDNYNKKIINENDKLPNISLHCLRHTIASILENNGLPYSILQEFLGHSKSKTVTGLYTHALKGSSEKIFSILQLLYETEEEKQKIQV